MVNSKIIVGQKYINCPIGNTSRHLLTNSLSVSNYTTHTFTAFFPGQPG